MAWVDLHEGILEAFVDSAADADRQAEWRTGFRVTQSLDAKAEGEKERRLFNKRIPTLQSAEKARQREYRKRERADPKTRAVALERQRRYRQRKATDPVYLAKEAARQRQYRSEAA